MSACEKCGSTEDLVEHHISYDPEIKQILCRSCNAKEKRKSNDFVRKARFKENDRVIMRSGNTPTRITRVMKDILGSKVAFYGANIVLLIPNEDIAEDKIFSDIDLMKERMDLRRVPMI